MKGREDMEYKAVNAHIARFTNGITYQFLKNAKRIIVFLGFISACFLATIGNIPVLGALIVLSVADWVCFSAILKRKTLTVYRSIHVSFLFVSYIAITFNVWLYCIQKTLHFFDLMFFLVLLVSELGCVVAGFFYTKKCIKKGKISKTQASLFPGAVVLVGAFGYWGIRYVVSQTSVLFQQVILTISFIFVIVMLMFILGMVHVAILYYIKKYDMLDQTRNSEDYPEC